MNTMTIRELKSAARKHGLMLVPLPPKTRSPTWRACAEFLLSILSEGAQPAKTVLRSCKQAGFSNALTQKAKRRLGVESIFVGKPGRPGVWFWTLPGDDEL